MGETTSGLIGGTRASVTPEKRIKKIKKKKSQSMSLSIKDPILNQDKKTLGKSDVPPFITVMKSLRNQENDDNPETTDTSRTNKDDTSHTNQDNSIENVKYTKNTNDDDKYKEDNLQHQDGN